MLSIFTILDAFLIKSSYIISVKLLWRGEECWTEFLNLLNVAEAAATAASSPHFPLNTTDFIVRRTLVFFLEFIS